VETAVVRRPSALLVSSIALVLILSALLITKLGIGKKSEVPAPAEIITLDRIDKDDIVRVELLSDNGNVILEKLNGKFRLRSHPLFDIDAGEVNKILLDFSAIYADSVVEKQPDDLAKFGLNPPAVTATAVLTNNETRTYKLGNKSAAGTYYLMEKDNTKVYEVPAKYGKHFNYSEDDFRDRTLLDISFNELKYLRLSRVGHRDIEIAKSSSGDNLSPGSWIITEPYSVSRKADPTVLADFFAEIVLDMIDQFIDESSDNLASFGLLPAQAELELRGSKESVVLLVGNPTKDKKYFGKLAGSYPVVTIDSQKLGFLNVNVYDLIEKHPFNENIGDVARIEILIESKTYKTRIEQVTDSNQLMFSVNGKAIEETAFLEFYFKLTGIIFAAETDSAPKNVPAVSVAVVPRDGSTFGESPQLIMEYFLYNTRYYILLINDDKFLVSKNQVTSMIEGITALAGT
jgi:hypothetical protein